MRIENWGVKVGNPYNAPEVQSNYLNGNVFGHPRFPDGYRVDTSRIVGERDGAVVTSSGSVYNLGEPAAEYEKLFPGAKARLLKTLKGFE